MLAARMTILANRAINMKAKTGKRTATSKTSAANAKAVRNLGART